MKIALKDNRRYVLRFDKGEKLMESLAAFMGQEKIVACSFSGIGTAADVELGYYNQHIKDYRKKRYLEDLEIVQITGNGALFTDGKPMVHAHATFSRTDFTSFSGHVFEILVQATCEIFLIAMEGELKRANSPDWNLNLLV